MKGIPGSVPELFIDSDTEKKTRFSMSQDAENGTSDIYWKPRPAMNQVHAVIYVFSWLQ